MQIIFDTCFLLRIQEIDRSLNLKLEEKLSKFIWAYSDELKLEYKRHHLQKWIGNGGIYIPLAQKEWDFYQKKYPLKKFDKADQEIVILGLRDGITIVTGDRDLFNLLKPLRIPVFQIWALLLKWVENEMISKNVMGKIINYWNSERHFSKKMIEVMKKLLQSIQ